MENTLKFLAIAAAAMLTACGGGGGGGITAAPATPTAPVAGSATLVTSVPAATYTGEQAIAFNLINTERNNCGFGLLAQNASLDAAAASHAAYTPLSGIQGENLHTEVPGRAGFTGVTQGDRAIAKGYPSQTAYVSEGMALGTGTTAVRGLLSAPYHLNTMLNGYRDIGIGMAPSNQPTLPYFVADYGVQNAAGGKQLFAADEVKTYPCNGTTGVNYLLRGEIPSPVPGRDLNANPIGTPILIKVRDGNSLVITNAAMIKVSTGAVIALRAPVGEGTDPNGSYGFGYFARGTAYIAPDAALSPGSQYQATITGTNNGAMFSRTITFTTGTDLN